MNPYRRHKRLIDMLIALAISLVAIIAVLVTAALPVLNRARMYAQEMAALKAIQTVNTAQVQYHSSFGRFAASLTELGPPASGAPTVSAAELIPGGLASGERQGYKFKLAGMPGGYSITAVPTVFGDTGSRTFYSDQSLLLRENYGPEPATANSNEVGSTAASSGASK